MTNVRARALSFTDLINPCLEKVLISGRECLYDMCIRGMIKLLNRIFLNTDNFLKSYMSNNSFGRISFFSFFRSCE